MANNFEKELEKYSLNYFQSFFGINFGGGGEIDIILEDADNRKVNGLSKILLVITDNNIGCPDG